MKKRARELKIDIELLGADITRLKVKKVDLVSDTTLVDVRFRLPEGRRSA